MKPSRWVVGLAAILASVLGWGAYQLVQPAPQSLASFMPDGAVLYLESPDFGALLHDWEVSPEHAQWLKSDNYAVFSRSRLFERLNRAQDEFAAAAGLPPDASFLNQVAGKQSAFAWYDIGKLEFLYVTRLPSSGFTSSSLWNARNSFQVRNAGQQTFYVRTDPQSGRVVAFAETPDLVLLSTREDLLANALARISGQKGRTVQDEAWFADSVAAAGQGGDLRMVLNLEKLVPSGYFRTYWIQQNVTEMKQYRAAISDLHRSAQEFREERVLLRRSEQATSSASGAETPANDVSDLLALVPESAGVYRASADPSTAETMAVLHSKLLSPRATLTSDNSLAPRVAIPASGPGNESDLETRIDEAPATAVVGNSPDEALRSELDHARLQGMLAFESSQAAEGGVFVHYHPVVVLKSATDWDSARVTTALQEVLEPQVTTSRLGIGWQKESSAKGEYFKLDGLVALAAAIRGPYLILSDDASQVETALGRLGDSHNADAPLVYAAGFQHAAESGTFLHVSALLDRTNLQPQENGERREPAFFSGNVGSLSKVFSPVESETMRTVAGNGKVTQTVTYRWRQ